MNLEEKLKFFKDKGYKYNPETGEVTSHTGHIITHICNNYVMIATHFNNKRICVPVHQFAWYMYYNEIPTEIDHWDTNKLNNKIKNLRNITHQQNCFNTKAKGYTFDKRTKKYQSQLMLNYKNIFLGYYDTPEEAHQAYIDAKLRYHKI